MSHDTLTRKIPVHYTRADKLCRRLLSCGFSETSETIDWKRTYRDKNGATTTLFVSEDGVRLEHCGLLPYNIKNLANSYGFALCELKPQPSTTEEVKQ